MSAQLFLQARRITSCDLMSCVNNWSYPLFLYLYFMVIFSCISSLTMKKRDSY